MSNDRVNNGIQISGDGKFRAENVQTGGQNQLTVHKETLHQEHKQGKEQQINILLICANPWNSQRLRLANEERAIREAINESPHRERIQLTVCPAATVEDLRKALLRTDFQIVHISGHGGTRGLLLEGEKRENGGHRVSPEELTTMLQPYYKNLQCLILNACTSESSMVTGIPYVIAMEDTLSDDAAIAFSRGFYDTIGSGRAIDFAYEEGQRLVQKNTPGLPFPIVLHTSH